MSSSYDEGYCILPLGRAHTFPDPSGAPKEGLLAYGGDLDPERVLKAYSMGIFPWYSPDDPILWWSPDPRLLLYPRELKISKSLRRVLRNSEYRVLFDHDFASVIESCARIERPGQEGSWLGEEMVEAYTQLHRRGFAHSVEVYRGERLIGGLYGIGLGAAFFGESMFSAEKNASKIALKALSDVLSERGYDFVDCQVVTEHLVRMGATVVSRERFLSELKEALSKGGCCGGWRDFEWEYADDR
jgi:leucyl/phenylalanyl-tRNA--protein transferase